MVLVKKENNQTGVVVIESNHVAALLQIKVTYYQNDGAQQSGFYGHKKIRSRVTNNSKPGLLVGIKFVNTSAGNYLPARI